MLDPETLEPTFSTAGDVSPLGICGSSMIDLISEMLLTGINGQNGKCKIDQHHYRMKKGGEDLAYIVAFTDETPMQQDIVFTEIDIHSLTLSKGSLYAGFMVLLEQARLDFSMTDRNANHRLILRHSRV